MASGIGSPVALKASSPDLLHKTEAGVIRLHLNSPEEVERSFEEIVGQAKKWNSEARLDGVLVEAIRDFVVWPAPLTLDEAREMIRRIRGYHILSAFRGCPAADLEALAQVLCQVGQLACQD